MTERPGVMIYFSNRPCIEALSDEDAGKLTKGFLKYAETGEEPCFEGALNLLFLMLRPRLDFDAERYERRCSQKRYAVYCREQNKLSLPKLSYEDWLLSADIAPYPNTTAETKSESKSESESETKSESESESETVSDTISAAAAAPTVTAPDGHESSFDGTVVRHFGRTGKVLLTMEKYFELMDEIGHREFYELLYDAEQIALSRGYDPEHLDWAEFLRFCAKQKKEREKK